MGKQGCVDVLIPLPALWSLRSAIWMLGWKVAPGREVNQVKKACVRASKSWDAISAVFFYFCWKERPEVRVMLCIVSDVLT
jgi:hypothetical protein